MGTGNVYSTYDPTSLFAGEPPVRHRPITLASGSNTTGTPLPRGTQLGRVTATDKYIPCVKTASDGSQAPVAVLAADTDAGAADVATTAYFEGEFAFEKMNVDASWTVTTLQAALRQAGSSIYVRSVGTLG
jgi:hypothetical protein